MKQSNRYNSTAAYPPFAVTVDVVLFTMRGGRLHVLLVERALEPFKGSWALPGGFVRMDEDLGQAAARELAEETALQSGFPYFEQLRAYGAPDRDPRMRVVTVVYIGVASETGEPEGGGDAARAELKWVGDLERGGVRLAFDHSGIVRDALDRIRSKLEYTALAARFCGPQFTIAQLREVYEVVWNTCLDPGNFQRGFRENACFVQCGDRRASSAQVLGRPAALWSLTDTADKGSVPLLTRPLAKRRY